MKGWTYELPVKLLSTPSDGIGPTRKLFDTLLPKCTKIILINIRFEVTLDNANFFY